MTVYILPCGVSILDGLSLGRGLPGGAADPTDLCAKAVPWAERARYSDDAMVVTRYQEDLDTVIDEARLGNWAAEVAAETNSLGSRKSQQGTHRRPHCGVTRVGHQPWRGRRHGSRRADRRKS